MSQNRLSTQIATVEEVTILAKMGETTFRDTYQEWTFQIVGSHRFILGVDVQNDFVMTRPIVLAK